METLKKHKWKIHWCAFGTLIFLFVFTAVFFENKTWVGNVLQAIGTVAGIYLTIIIFLFSKEDSDKQFREHIEHLQELNTKQIEALHTSTERQITALQDTNAKQISALQELTDKQISALQELTEKQIDALHRTTNEQISAFEQQTREVTDKLSDNSILLAEILGRELEKSIDIFTNAVNQAEAKYTDLSGWKLFRTEVEKEQQLNNQWTRIQNIKRGLEYMMTKYNKVRQFLGFGTKQLNG